MEIRCTLPRERDPLGHHGLADGWISAVLAGFLFLVLSAAHAASFATNTAAGIEPPAMSPRQVAPPQAPWPGDRLALEESGVPVILWLPTGCDAPGNHGRLAVHFHTADWLAIGEHLRAGYTFPLASIYLGAGSSRYRAPFEDPATWTRLIARIESELKKRDAHWPAIAWIDVSSFSAGYGAVRELVQQPAAREKIRRIVLSDSLYGGLAQDLDKSGTRRVEPDHIRSWEWFARAAMRGEKVFVFTHSAIPTESFASTFECAAALADALGVKSAPVAHASCAAAADPRYPLRTRLDVGNLHIWGYAGEDAEAHLVHPRRLADVWRSIDSLRVCAKITSDFAQTLTAR